MDDEEKVLAGRHDADIPAALTKDFTAGDGPPRALDPGGDRDCKAADGLVLFVLARSWRIASSPSAHTIASPRPDRVRLIARGLTAPAMRLRRVILS
jgi:hypothetical protein